MDTDNMSLSDASFEMGLLVILAAQILSAFMGAYVEGLYEEHGKHWDENLFYSHFLSLPLFLPLQPSLQSQYQRLASSPPLELPPSLTASLPSSVRRLLTGAPQTVLMLVLNSVTQLLCITGVNLLGANSSAVTVTIVLNIRKLVSFMLSIWLFGNELSGQMLLGSVLVFGAGALYGWETSVRIKSRNARQVHAKENGKAQ